MAVARSWISSPFRELFERSAVALSQENSDPPFEVKLNKRHTDKGIVWPGPCWQEDSILIYGYYSLATTIGTISLGLSVIGLTAILLIKQHQSLAIFILSLLAMPTGILVFWLSGHHRANRFIAFDEKRQLVHFSNQYNGRLDTLKWEESSYLIYDENHIYRPYSYCNTKVALVRPPHDLIKNGAPPARKPQKIMDLDGEQFTLWNSIEAESIYRYIISFMTNSAPDSPSAEVKRNDQNFCQEHYAGNWHLMRRIEGWRWYRLDLEKLPNQPNWIRHPNGRWERTGPGVKVLRPWWDNLIKPRRIPKNQGTERPGT